MPPPSKKLIKFRAVELIFKGAIITFLVWGIYSSASYISDKRFEDTVYNYTSISVLQGIILAVYTVFILWNTLYCCYALLEIAIECYPEYNRLNNGYRKLMSKVDRGSDAATFVIATFLPAFVSLMSKNDDHQKLDHGNNTSIVLSNFGESIQNITEIYDDSQTLEEKFNTFLWYQIGLAILSGIALIIKFPFESQLLADVVAPQLQPAPEPAPQGAPQDAPEDAPEQQGEDNPQAIALGAAGGEIPMARLVQVQPVDLGVGPSGLRERSVSPACNEQE